MFGRSVLGRSIFGRSIFGRGRILPLLLLATSAGYAHSPTEPSPSPAVGWRFHVVVPERGPAPIAVEAAFDGAGTDRLTIEPRSMPHVRDLESWTHDRGGAWVSVGRGGAGWIVPACRTACTVRYRIDLTELAERCGDELGCARRVPRDAILSPALAWLVHPSPPRDVPVTVHVQTPDAGSFATGLRPAEGAPPSSAQFSFHSPDLDEGSFAAFGPARRHAIDVGTRLGGRGQVEVVLVGTARYAAPDSRLRSWVEDGAGEVSALFGHFPVERATIFVVPAEGMDNVLSGRVLSLAGPSIALVVGDQTPPSTLEHDWLLVHELFHLGFPTFRGEGRWLSEGLATYYEPVLRARARRITESEVYQGFVRRMPRGQRQPGAAQRLVDRSDPDGIYWGGAIFCFAADVRIRSETDGRSSLDDVLRATLELGGDATQVWALRDVLRLGDRVTGTSILTDMFERHAVGGELIDLEGLFASLGVVADAEERTVTFDDHTSLAGIRRAIVAGPAEPALRRRDLDVRR